MNHEAIRNIYPIAVTIRGEEAFDANDNPITLDQSLITAEVTRLQDIYDSQEYARNRAKDYPPLEEQLDYIYHNGVEAWKADMILPVKTKHPKGGN